jgi:hypothetical protein
MPADYSLSGMNNLSVYIKPSWSEENSDQLRCGTPWKYKSGQSIDMDCGRNMKGTIVRVTVPSSAPTHLAICSIVLNRDKGRYHVLNLSEETASLVSSIRNDSNKLAALTVDQIVSSSECTLVNGVEKAWLRMEIRRVIYIGEIRIRFGERIRGSTNLFAGRSLKNNGSLGNTKCGTSTKNSLVSYWMNVTCNESVLAQFIYIESSSAILQICHIQVLYIDILNIYPHAYVTASDQEVMSGSIWKPVDGIIDPSEPGSMISLKSSQSWWRVEFPKRLAIFKVRIHKHVPEQNDIGEVMEGFSVHIGDSELANGKINEVCGEPWKGKLPQSVLEIECNGTLIGKYLYVVAANQNGSALYFNEIIPFGCEEPTVEISRTDYDNTRKESTLTCIVSTSGCHVSKILWIAADNNTINGSSEVKGDGKTSSSIIISRRAFEGPYTCLVNYSYRGRSNAILKLAGKHLSPSVKSLQESTGSTSSAIPTEMSEGSTLSATAAETIRATPKSDSFRASSRQTGNLEIIDSC